MKTVFLAGSRSLSRLNDTTRQRLDKVLAQGIFVVVGDANGADKAFQAYLAQRRYQHVAVYCSGTACRNNLGPWKAEHVPVPDEIMGREFYAQKDKKMAERADYGFMLWDGKSAGTVANIVEMLRQGKKVLVFFARESDFLTISTPADAKALLSRADKKAITEIDRKLGLTRSLRELECPVQAPLGI